MKVVNNPQQRRITRKQGYVDNAWKEEQSKAVFKSFTEHYGLDLREVTDMKSQITLGDYRHGDRYIECKSQNIGQYQQNFIEVGEYDTGRDIHRDGHLAFSEWLSNRGVNLSDCNINQRNGTKERQKFGSPSAYNHGFTPLMSGADVFYINRDTNLIFFYRSGKLQQLIVDEISNDRLYWGGGRSNETTLAVFVENSPIAWQKVNGKWKFLGSEELEQQVLAYLERYKC
jgi:hypothetical protein